MTKFSRLPWFLVSPLHFCDSCQNLQTFLGFPAKSSLFCPCVYCVYNNNNHDSVYGAIIRPVIVRIHPVHLMNVDWVPGGRQPSDQASRFGLRVHRKLAATVHIHHRHCNYYSAHKLILTYHPTEAESTSAEYVCVFRYTGHVNTEYRIDSVISSTDRHVVSGSEDGHIYIWHLVDVRYLLTATISYLYLLGRIALHSIICGLLFTCS